MFLLLLVFYSIVAVWMLRRSIRKDVHALTTLQITIAFVFKVMMGCAYGYIFLVKYDGDDTWFLHEYSLGQQDLFLNDPWWFIVEMNPVDSFTRPDPFTTNFYYYLAYLESWVLGKPFALLNFLSGGNYYVNIVFFNIPVFFGQYWLYRMMKTNFKIPGGPLYVGIFLVPPVVFWLSGLRADGILFFLIMLAMNYFIKAGSRPSLKNVGLLLLACCGIFIFRSLLLFLLIPPFFAWLLVRRFALSPVKTFAGVYLSCIVLFFGSMLISPGKNAASLIVSRQQEFFELQGNTRFSLDTLQPDALSFLKILPQAINNTFLRPYPWEAKGLLQYAAVMEVFFLIGLLALALFRPVVHWRESVKHPLILTLLGLAVTLYIVTGYTVPFPGAIVRYKIIGEVFLLTVCIVFIDWDRVTRRRIT